MNAALPEEYRDLPSFAFGDSPALADEIAGLVCSGRKTATAMTPDNPNRPRIGERWIVLDGARRPVCAIETVELTPRRFDEVDEAFAFDAGEGDRTLASWRADYENYLSRTGGFAPDMELLCERFRLLAVFPRRDDACVTTR